MKRARARTRIARSALVGREAFMATEFPYVCCPSCGTVFSGCTSMGAADRTGQRTTCCTVGRRSPVTWEGVRTARRYAHDLGDLGLPVHRPDNHLRCAVFRFSEKRSIAGCDVQRRTGDWWTSPHVNGSCLVYTVPSDADHRLSPLNFHWAVTIESPEHWAMC